MTRTILALYQPFLIYKYGFFIYVFVAGCFNDFFFACIYIFLCGLHYKPFLLFLLHSLNEPRRDLPQCVDSTGSAGRRISCSSETWSD